jgi:excisionase family DNA binding protein
VNIPELMTVSDFLDSFRISRTSFYREVGAGRLRIVKLGRATRIARDDAEAWMAQLRGSQGAQGR